MALLRRLAGKIRSGTTEQTTQQQLQLFDKVQGACGAAVEEVPEEETPSPPKTAVKLTQDEAGRIIILAGCVLLFASQGFSLPTRNSSSAFQTHMSSCGITSIVAGLMLLVPTVCQLSEEQYLFVGAAHLAQLLPSFRPMCLIALIHWVTTLMLMAAWAVLAWGVWQLREPTTPVGEGPPANSKGKTS